MTKLVKTKLMSKYKIMNNDPSTFNFNNVQFILKF